MTKSLVFGAIIALIGCFKGLNCGMGAEGVGQSTTSAVVVGSLAILLSDFFLTKILF